MTSIRILGWIHAVLGGVGLIGGVLIIVGGALTADSENIRALYWIIPPILMLDAVYFLPAFAGGIGLLRGRRWARVVIVIVSALILVMFPIGTALGGFGLWALLRRTGRDEFAAAAPTHPAKKLSLSLPDKHDLSVLVAMVGVAAGFVAAIGTGFRLAGDRAASPIPDDLYYVSIAILLATVIAAGFWFVSQRGAPAEPMLLWRQWGRRKALKRWRQEQAEAQRQLVAKLADDPKRRPYVARIQRGEPWSEAQIDYIENPEVLTTCAHLQPIERAMRRQGLTLRLLSDRYISAPCLLDVERLRAQRLLLPPADYAEPVIAERSLLDPPSSMLVCSLCSSAIHAVPKHDAKPDTPVFPGRA